MTCQALVLPAGLGEPVFEKLDANLAKALMSIGAVKAVEIGDGTKASLAKGSENNDWYALDDEGIPYKSTNHSGGILGGISDGSPLLVKVSFKPTSSIAAPQPMLGRDGKLHENVSIHGRHDPLIVPRAVVVVEAMTALTLIDLLLLNMSSQMKYLQQIYQPPLA